jgi:glutamine amidotransferase
VPRLPVAGLKIPHMGWNEVMQARPHPLWAGIPTAAASISCTATIPRPRRGADGGDLRVRRALYLRRCRDNIFAVQFHPEKSQSAGLQLLSNFVRWHP